MPLNSKIQVPLPESGIIVRSNTPCPYVYKVLRTFRNEKGQPTNTRQLIGKLDPETGMLIPNDNYYIHFGNMVEDVLPFTEPLPPVEKIPSVDSVHSIGAAFLIRCLLTDLGVVDILIDSCGKEKADAILTAAIYMVCKGNVFEHVADWCETSTLYETPLTSQKSSALFASITHEDRMFFFRLWIEIQKCLKYIAYDVTSFSSYAKEIAESEWGYNRDGDKLPQINLGCYTCEESGIPLFYVTYSGSIVDKSHLPYMMAYNDDLGIKDICFAMDMGFCTTPNLKFMHSSNYCYITAADPRHKTPKAAIGEVRDGIVSMRNHIEDDTYGHSVHGTFYGVKTTIHVYYNPDKAKRQHQELYRTVESQEENLRQLQKLTQKQVKKYSAFFDIEKNKDGTFTFSRNYDKIDIASRNHGFFCLLSNTSLSSSEVLALYRRKDVIEKGFDDLKNHTDQKRMHTHTSATTDGKMFCAFIALTPISVMNEMIRSTKIKGIRSKGAILSEMDKIKVVTLKGGTKLMNPVTKKQRLILKSFGINEERLHNYVYNINRI
jgi:transposase